MNKAFTDEELVRFLNFLDDPRAILLFTFQAVLGLRIGEAVRVHIKDINLKTKDLRIDTEKGKRTDYLPIPPELFAKTLDFVTQYETDICSHQGYLFWADFYPKRNKCPYLSSNHARNIFARAVRKSKLDETYAIAEGKIPKLLHRLTTHSLRHYAVTNFAKKNNGNIMLASKFARHRNVNTTMIYVHSDRDELYRSIMNAQDGGVLEKIRKMQDGLK